MITIQAAQTVLINQGGMNEIRMGYQQIRLGKKPSISGEGILKTRIRAQIHREASRSIKLLQYIERNSAGLGGMMIIEFITNVHYPDLIFAVINSENKAAITKNGLYVKTIGFLAFEQNEQILTKMKELQLAKNEIQN